MRLRVTNLGPVREAEIDLSKPLIILTGPNNSGKTYLSWVVYSLACVRPSSGSIPAGVQRVADQLCEASDQTSSSETIETIKTEILEYLAHSLRRQLASDFGAPKSRFDKTVVSLIEADGLEFARPGFTRLRLDRGRDFMLFPRSSGTGVRLTVVPLASLLDEDLDDIEKVQVFFASLDDASKAAIKLAVAKLLIRAPIERDSIAFPVERLAINLFARELAANRTSLVDDLLNESEDVTPTHLREHLQRRAGQYPRVIRDALQRAIEHPRTGEVGPFADLADELEASVLGGRIKVNVDTDLEFAPAQATDQASIGLHETASVVKSLASLVLFLRYQAQPGQRLLIDEPELNLHPNSQRKIAQVLATAVNRGLKILMSTHSDYVIRELNNLIMLGQDSAKARALTQELGYDAKAILQAQSLGVYLIANGECRVLPVTETGFEVDTIDEAIQSLNNDAQEIYLRLFSE